MSYSEWDLKHLEESEGWEDDVARERSVGDEGAGGEHSERHGEWNEVPKKEGR